MVEVTISNFVEMLPKIEEAVEVSNFIAIDSEFTGLYLSATDNISLFDNLENRYQKLKSRASAFLPCQIGLSFFKKNKEENVYLVETYIFYIRPYLCGSLDKRFMCQASCLDFLCKYDFDFNKFIKEGIPYLNESEEEQIQKEIKEGTISYTHEKIREFKPKQELDMLINNMIESSATQETECIPSKEEKPNRIILEKERDCHEFFQVNELRLKYPSLAIYSEDGKIVIENVAVEKIKELHQNTEQEANSLLDFYLGFTKVFRLLKTAKKPIVGHNLLMDLLLFYHNFHKPLPETYNQFKMELHNIFPIIFDTRHIWLHVKKFYKLKYISTSSSLFDLVETFQNPTDSLSVLYSPDVKNINSAKYHKEEFPHESGYDSYVTGWVFLKISHVLALNKISNPMFIQPQSFKQYLQAVSPFKNKLNNSRAIIRYIDLENDDPTPQESQLLHIKVKNKKKYLNHIELSRLMDRYGAVEFKLKGNKREAILAVGNLRSFQEILKDFEKDPDFMVTKYNVFKHSSAVHTALWLVTLGTFSAAVLCFVKYLPRS